MKQMMFFLSRSSCQFANFIVSKYALPETKFGLRDRDRQESGTVNAIVYGLVSVMHPDWLIRSKFRLRRSDNLHKESH